MFLDVAFVVEHDHLLLLLLSDFPTHLFAVVNNTLNISLLFIPFVHDLSYLIESKSSSSTLFEQHVSHLKVNKTFVSELQLCLQSV